MDVLQDSTQSPSLEWCVIQYNFSPVLLGSLLIQHKLKGLIQDFVTLPNALAWDLLDSYTFTSCCRCNKAYDNTALASINHSKFIKIIHGQLTQGILSGDAGCAAWDIFSSPCLPSISVRNQYQSCFQ